MSTLSTRTLLNDWKWSKGLAWSKSTPTSEILKKGKRTSELTTLHLWKRTWVYVVKTVSYRLTLNELRKTWSKLWQLTMTFKRKPLSLKRERHSMWNLVANIARSWKLWNLKEKEWLWRKSSSLSRFTKLKLSQNQMLKELKSNSVPNLPPKVERWKDELKI